MTRGLLCDIEEEPRDHRIGSHPTGCFGQRCGAADVKKHEYSIFPKGLMIAPKNDVGEDTPSNKPSHQQEELQPEGNDKRESSIPDQIPKCGVFFKTVRKEK